MWCSPASTTSAAAAFRACWRSRRRRREACLPQRSRALLQARRRTRLAQPFKTGESPMSPAEARLQEVPSEMTEAEWTQRINLAACYRLVALYGWDDLVDNHISAGVGGPGHHFLFNPCGVIVNELIR